jgi:hypothetical protein
MNIFISYRRGDTQDFAGRLADRLRATPGITEVFIDVDGIDPGDDFLLRVKAALSQSHAAIITIGKAWSGTSSIAPSRLFEDQDFVRLELREALKSEAKVFPILVNGALMPSAENLPEDLRRIAALHALPVRHTDFEHDMSVLLDALFSRKKPRQPDMFSKRHPFLARSLQSVGGAAAVLVLLVVGLAIFNAITGLSLGDVVGGPGPVAILVGILVVVGAAAPRLILRR